MKRLVANSEESVYDSIRRGYPLVATFTDDLYGQVLSLYDEGDGRFALLDDQNREVAEVREHPNADSNWIHRYVRHIQQYLCKRTPTVEYSPEYDINACSEAITSSMQVNAHDISALRSGLLDACREYLLDAGYSEVRESRYDMTVDDMMPNIWISEEGDRIKVEIGAELGYGEMIDLTNRLDPIVARYDENAYFDMEDPGLAVAYLE